jgi:hypothetical protein
MASAEDSFVSLYQLARAVCDAELTELTQIAPPPHPFHTHQRREAHHADFERMAREAAPLAREIGVPFGEFDPLVLDLGVALSATMNGMGDSWWFLHQAEPKNATRELRRRIEATQKASAKLCRFMQYHGHSLPLSGPAPAPATWDEVFRRLAEWEERVRAAFGDSGGRTLVPGDLTDTSKGSERAFAENSRPAPAGPELKGKATMGATNSFPELDSWHARRREQKQQEEQHAAWVSQARQRVADLAGLWDRAHGALPDDPAGCADHFLAVAEAVTAADLAKCFDEPHPDSTPGPSDEADVRAYVAGVLRHAFAGDRNAVLRRLLAARDEGGAFFAGVREAVAAAKRHTMYYLAKTLSSVAGCGRVELLSVVQPLEVAMDVLDRAEAAEAGTAPAATDQGEGGTPPAKRLKGIPLDEANVRVRDWLAANAKDDPAGITRDGIADGTGVSKGQVSNTPAWIAFRDRRKAGAKPAAREIPLTTSNQDINAYKDFRRENLDETLERRGHKVSPADAMQAVVPSDCEGSDELAALIEEQKKDEAEQGRRHKRRHGRS